MVKITLEYASVEEAIQALGKLSGLAKVRRAATATPMGAPTPEEDRTDKAASLAPVAPTTRKGRADKGKLRGPHKKAAPQDSSEEAGTLASPPASGTAEQGVALPVEPAAAAPVPVNPAAPSEADAKVALEAYFDRHGPQKAMALLAGFGVSKLRELPEDQRAKFIEECKA